MPSAYTLVWVFALMRGSADAFALGGAGADAGRGVAGAWYAPCAARGECGYGAALAGVGLGDVDLNFYLCIS